MTGVGLYPGVSLDPRALLRNRETAGAFPFSAPRVHFFGMARTAIWYGVQVLGLQPGDEVLAPIYNCGAEIDPLVQAGLTLVYYSVDEALNARPEEIAALITPRTKCVYLTHYLGFPQKHAAELASLCRSRGVPLIEDCAHGLFGRYEGGEALGTLGDIAIFSLRKSLAVGDGAALVINRPDLPEPRAALRHALLPATFAPGRHGPSRVYYALRDRARGARELPATAGGFEGELPGTLLPRGERFLRPWSERHGMSFLTGRVAPRADAKDIARRRRENFSAILAAASSGDGFRPLFGRLPEGTVPLAFPFVAGDPQRLVDGLRARGVPALRWWSRFHSQCPWQSFPEAVQLKNHVVAVAVHQRMTPDVLSAAVRELGGQGSSGGTVDSSRPSR